MPSGSSKISRALSREGYGVQATGTAATLWRWIEDGAGDVAILDVVLPDENALDLLPRIKQRRPGLPVIMIDRPPLPARHAVDTVDAVLDWLDHGADRGV